MKTIECFEEYVSCQKRNGKSVREHYQRILSILKGERLQEDGNNEVARYFIENRNDVLKMCSLPVCPDCSQCQLREGCRYPLLYEVESNIQRLMKTGVRDQNALFDVFN